MLALDDVRAAREHVETVARRIPLEYSHTFPEMTGAGVCLKLESSQRTGSFRTHGVTSRITTLSDEEKVAGIVTASTGNHAQGVALAASRANVNPKIIISEYAPISKVKATERYGGNMVLYGNDYDGAWAKAHEIEKSEGRTCVHAFGGECIMAGQGTIGLKIAEDCPDLDTMVVPIGGGGLISGIPTAIREQYPDAHVIGMQAEQASSAADSLNRGSIQTIDEVDTIAGGIAVRRIGDEPFEATCERVDEVVTVPDGEIAVALTYLLGHSKTLVEGARAAALAALAFQKLDYEESEVVIPALCGGNIDMNTLTVVVMRGLVGTGRYLKIQTGLKDHPGLLGQLVRIIAAEKVSIYVVRHDHTPRKIVLNATEVEIDLEMRGPDRVESPLKELRNVDYDMEILD